MLFIAVKLCCAVPAQTNACSVLKALHLEDCRNCSRVCLGQPHMPCAISNINLRSQFQLLASTLQSTTLIKCTPCYIEKRSASQQWQCTLLRCCRAIYSLSATFVERPHAHFLSHFSSSMMQMHVATCYLHAPTRLQTQRVRRHAQRPRTW